MHTKLREQAGHANSVNLGEWENIVVAVAGASVAAVVSSIASQPVSESAAPRGRLFVFPTQCQTAACVARPRAPTAPALAIHALFSSSACHSRAARGAWAGRHPSLQAQSGDGGARARQGCKGGARREPSPARPGEERAHAYDTRHSCFNLGWACSLTPPHSCFSGFLSFSNAGISCLP